MSKKFEIKKFDLSEIDVRAETSKYPFDELEVGEGFVFEGKSSSISGRVSAQNKKGPKRYVSRVDAESTPEKPIVNVIRVE